MLVIPASYITSVLLLATFSVLLRKVLLRGSIGKPEASSELWGFKSMKDTVWQAVNLVLCGYGLEMTRGSFLSGEYVRSLGGEVSGRGVYLDLLGLINPDLVKVGTGSCIGGNALLFGHVYEGGGEVKLGSNVVGEFGSVGARSLLPGSVLEDGAELRPLALAMKD